MGYRGLRLLNRKRKGENGKLVPVESGEIIGGGIGILGIFKTFGAPLTPLTPLILLRRDNRHQNNNHAEVLCVVVVLHCNFD